MLSSALGTRNNSKFCFVLEINSIRDTFLANLLQQMTENYNAYEKKNIL